jgi:hypothetical protein
MPGTALAVASVRAATARPSTTSGLPVQVRGDPGQQHGRPADPGVAGELPQLPGVGQPGDVLVPLRHRPGQGREGGGAGAVGELAAPVVAVAGELLGVPVRGVRGDQVGEVAEAARRHRATRAQGTVDLAGSLGDERATVTVDGGVVDAVEPVPAVGAEVDQREGERRSGGEVDRHGGTVPLPPQRGGLGVVGGADIDPVQRPLQLGHDHLVRPRVVGVEDGAQRVGLGDHLPQHLLEKGGVQRAVDPHALGDAVDRVCRVGLLSEPESGLCCCQRQSHPVDHVHRVTPIVRTCVATGKCQSRRSTGCSQQNLETHGNVGSKSCNWAAVPAVQGILTSGKNALTVVMRESENETGIEVFDLPLPRVRRWRHARHAQP